MSDKRISELTALAGASVADNDAFAIVDTSTTQTKKIFFSELKAALDTSTGFVRITGDTMTGNLSFGDDDKAIFGAGSDLTIEHNGTNSTITNTTGTLTIQNTADDEDVDIVSDDGSGGTAVYFRADGSSGQAKLYHNDSGTSTLRLNTSSDGIDVTGSVTTDGLGVNTTSPKGMVHVNNSGTRPNFLSSGAGDADLDFAVDHDEVMQLGRYNKSTEAVDAVVMSLELDGDVTIEDGNLVVASGHGIDFSATSGSGESEILNDYEEGSFTPTLQSSSGSNPTVGGSASGRYTKIGDVVTIYISVTNITGGNDASGILEIHSLPFSPTTSDTVGTVMLDNFTFVSGTTYCVSYCDASADLILFKQIRDTTTDASIDNDNIDDGSADFITTIQYRTTS